MRDSSFSIVKALAIILVVVAHAAAPTYVARFAYLINVPVFFVLAGYFFHLRNLEEKTQFVIRRMKRLYIPFIKWSIFFLLIHNLLFPLGILSETYGNVAGGVTHPYTWQQATQRLWSIVFNMSGYDEFLAGSFWFFRALLLSSFAFLLLFKGATLIKWLKTPTLQVAAIAGLMILLAIWQTVDGLKITGVAQGGYRELMGVFFMSCGFLLRRMEANEKLSIANHPIVGISVGLVATIALTTWYPVSMAHRAGGVWSIFALALAGVSGFMLLRHLSAYINRIEHKVKDILVFIGDNTIYVFGFHLLAFKLVSALKVGVYGLPWEMVGGHTVVTEHRDDWFWLLYAIVGTAIPLLWVWGWRVLCERHNLKTNTPLDWVRTFIKLAILLYRQIIKGTILLGLGIFSGAKATYNGASNIVKASLPNKSDEAENDEDDEHDDDHDEDESDEEEDYDEEEEEEDNSYKLSLNKITSMFKPS